MKKYLIIEDNFIDNIIIGEEPLNLNTNKLIKPYSSYLSSSPTRGSYYNSELDTFYPSVKIVEIKNKTNPDIESHIVLGEYTYTSASFDESGSIITPSVESYTSSSFEVIFNQPLQNISPETIYVKNGEVNNLSTSGNVCSFDLAPTGKDIKIHFDRNQILSINGSGMHKLTKNSLVLKYEDSGSFVESNTPLELIPVS